MEFAASIFVGNDCNSAFMELTDLLSALVTFQIDFSFIIFDAHFCFDFIISCLTFIFRCVYLAKLFSLNALHLSLIKILIIGVIHFLSD
jgi:hypothetical protein